MGGCQISLKKALRRLRFKVISVTRGWVGVEFSEKKRYEGYGSRLLALRGGGWVSNFQKKSVA